MFIFLSILCGTYFFLEVLENPGRGEQYAMRFDGATYLGKEGVVIQTDRNNCGPCSLKMIFDHFKIPSLLTDIESDIGYVGRKVTFQMIQASAQRKGIKSEAWKVSFRDLATKPFPSLLLVRNSHYVVADSIVNDDIYMRDPALGRISMHKNNLSTIWKGESLLFWKE